MYDQQNFPFLKTTLSLFIACIAHSAYAIDDTSKVQKLDTIVIEATRTDRDVMATPASAYYIQQEPQKGMNVNLSEALKGVPGLQLNNRENYAQDLQISMRGFGARSSFGVRGVRLYVDGIPATMPDGQGQTSNIDLNSLDHIEVLGGGLSSLYGNSSGGTILTTTREGQGDDSITLGYAGGSENKGQASLVLQGGAKNANEPSYILSSSYFDTDGFRDHSGANKVLSNAKLTWNLDDGSKINWINNYVKIDADDPGGLTREQWKANPKQVAGNVSLYNARKEIEQLQTGLTWNKPLNDQHEIYAMAYAGQRSVTQYQSIPQTAQGGANHAGGVIDFDRNFYGTDVRWTGKELLPNLKLIAGVAIDAMTEERRGYENFAGSVLGVKGNLRRNEDNTLWNIDPYAQASYAINDVVNVDAGLRYSNVHFKTEDHFLTNGDNSGKTDYQKLLPSLALSWQIVPELMAYASYAQGFETPTFTEMAYPAVTANTPFSLKAAESETYELGLKSDNVLGQFTAAAFYTLTKDDIVPLKNEGGKATFRNADQTLRQGIELSWQKDLWRDLSAQASYSYIDATFDKDTVDIAGISPIPNGNYIPGIAKNQAFLALGWKPENGLRAGVDVRYSDKIYVDDSNSDTAPSYVVAAANIGYKWTVKDWAFNTFARVDNLFDKDYSGSVIVNESNKRFFEPAEGRNWSAGLSVTKEF
ncbi:MULTISPECIES: TonB-dependent receptor family protein [Acinetobacter]|jgi:iron complex outermembrane receptor protein|uniref:TonB-dependent receptor n=1 Tax=Acinetobacter chengduensis TaxID=2420890 RepID=A0ABX9TYY5_9GAMM|nr:MULTISPECIES: TonB-dependent receptor [Acinetobacter]MBI1451262.1 TonB-dependent receptor [Acinetobacter sp. FL51]RKG43722.1 TonB-dependent receptor [Acinetobacter sp. WCHAc060007]RLL23875.1 TonB-dependent receptor [Acinetobacter chengduensis]